MTSPVDFAYYGSMSPVAPAPIAPVAHGSTSSASFAATVNFTLPSSYSTQTGDCIVIAIDVSGNPTVGVSGCGATWNVETITMSTAGTLVNLIGYACTSGGTNVAITGLSALFGDLVCGVFTGVQSSPSPIGTYQTNVSASASTLTTPSVSYTAGQIVLGSAGQINGTNWSAPAWSDGDTNNPVATSVSQRIVRLDYNAPIVNSSTTYQATATGGAGRMAVAAVTLTPV